MLELLAELGRSHFLTHFPPVRPLIRHSGSVPRVALSWAQPRGSMSHDHAQAVC
jgi:hypothetical protein